MCNTWCGISENSLEKKPRYFPKIMWSSLLADDKKKMRPFVGNDRGGVSGKSLELKPRYCREYSLFKK